MHVLVVVPGGVDRGGEERVIPVLLALIERLARRHRVTVVALGQERDDSRYELLGATVRNVRLPPPGGPLAPLRLLDLVRRAVAASGAEGRPDVVHGFWAGVSGMVAVAIGGRHRVPVVVSAAGGELVDRPDIGYGGSQGRGGRLIARLAFGRADVVTVASGWMAAQVRGAGHRVDRQVVLGIDPERYTPGPASERRPHRVCCVASLNRVKDPGLLVEAFALVRRQLPAATLELIGVDTLAGETARHAERLGLGSDAVQFAGFVRPADLPARLARAEVHVLTSHHDAAPVAVLEAAACGLATVGTAIGHVTDLAALDPPAAVMVPDRTPEAVAAAIVGLLTDPDARGRIADAARTWVLAHDADRTAHDFEEIYAALRASRRAR